MGLLTPEASCDVGAEWLLTLPSCLLSLLQIAGDLEDLEPALNKTSTKLSLGSGSCSALIKLLPGARDLLVAHNTWNSYQNMLRIIKKYRLQFREGPQGGRNNLAGGRCTGAGILFYFYFFKIDLFYVCEYSVCMCIFMPEEGIRSHCRWL